MCGCRLPSVPIRKDLQRDAMMGHMTNTMNMLRGTPVASSAHSSWQTAMKSVFVSDDRPCPNCLMRRFTFSREGGSCFLPSGRLFKWWLRSKMAAKSSPLSMVPDLSRSHWSNASLHSFKKRGDDVNELSDLLNVSLARAASRPPGVLGVLGCAVGRQRASAARHQRSGGAGAASTRQRASTVGRWHNHRAPCSDAGIT